MLLVAMQWIMTSHRLEAEEFVKSMESATSLTKMVEAQSEFFKARGGVPRWMIAIMAFELMAGLNWIAMVVCGIIGVRRPNHRRLAITALVVAGLVPIVFCCGGLFFGPSDMSQSLGIPLQFDHPRLVEARKLVAATAAKHGKFWGMPVPDAARARQLHDEEGAQFFACGAPVFLLKNAYQAIRDDFDKVFGE